MTDVLKLYKAESYGKLFQYFFELYVIAFTMGVATDEFEKNRKNIHNMDRDVERTKKYDRVVSTANRRDSSV